MTQLRPLYEVREACQKRYEETRIELQPFLAKGTRIFHVGSTALSDGITKGDIGVLVLVASVDFEPLCLELEKIYARVPGFFEAKLGGASFAKRNSEPPVVLYVVIEGSPSDVQRMHLQKLRGDIALRIQYRALKEAFKAKDILSSDENEYLEAKANFFTNEDMLKAD